MHNFDLYYPSHRGGAVHMNKPASQFLCSAKWGQSSSWRSAYSYSPRELSCSSCLCLTACRDQLQLPTRMWANAQHDGRPAEDRWRPLFNATKFGWRPLLECRAVTLPRREISWNLQGCPKLPNWSQPLVGRSLPYYEDIWRTYCCLTSFFSDCRYIP